MSPVCEWWATKGKTNVCAKESENEPTLVTMRCKVVGILGQVPDLSLAANLPRTADGRTKAKKVRVLGERTIFSDDVIFMAA